MGRREGKKKKRSKNVLKPRKKYFLFKISERLNREIIIFKTPHL